MFTDADITTNWIMVALLCATIAYYVVFNWYSAAARIERRRGREK